MARFDGLKRQNLVVGGGLDRANPSSLRTAWLAAPLGLVVVCWLAEEEGVRESRDEEDSACVVAVACGSFKKEQRQGPGESAEPRL